MTGVGLVSFSRELHVCSRATYSKGQTFSQSLKREKKKCESGQDWARWEGAAGVSALASTAALALQPFSAEFLESGFPFGGNQQSADVRAAGCNVLSVSEKEELLGTSAADTAL